MDISKINRKLKTLSFGNNNLKKEINKDNLNINNHYYKSIIKKRKYFSLKKKFCFFWKFIK
jgi:hypothetical protein